ncbi:MAG: peptidoglycan-associated lipoprotein Pal [Rhodospirillaceae bacterium]|nr:peptidoglycan-associated lipoprotein Pal [Rhodospirillaceae bacterium]
MKLKTALVVLAVGLATVGCSANSKDGVDGDRTAATATERPDAGTSWQNYTAEENNGYSDRVFFAYDRFDLDDDARSTIRAWASWLRAHPDARILVEGHTDERGTREYNLGLGAKRAAAVRDQLIALGVDAARIQTISYGKERPAVAGENESAYQQNRRGVARPSGGGA